MDLITLEEYKSYKNIGNPEKDSTYNIIIPSVSDLIKEYCGRTFIDYYSTPKTEVHSIREGVNAVVLTEIPLKVVSGVTSAGTDITRDVTIDSINGFLYTNYGFFTPGYEVLSIRYLGGYAETPSDLKLAAFELVDYYAQGEHKARKTFGGTSVEYHPSKSQWPFHIKSILDMYKDV